ncbi:MAG: tungstate ABC transporter substrate-binding protein WtpA [Candidatus Saliniplasma sp.]
MKKTMTIICILLLAFTVLSGCIGPEEDDIIKIYHAGSLSGPFSELERRFEKQHPNIDVRREMSGSVETVRKVTDQGKEADVVGVADHSLIPDLMYDEHASWTVRFATNRMVLAHTNESNHADEISVDNWYEILQRDDVKFGFSNPNHDPCGYRSQIMIRLAQEHYDEEDLFSELIEKNTAIMEENGTITVPENLEPVVSKVMIRSAEMELIYGLETGDIDYLFIYQSVVEQHEGLEMVSLPEKIDLGSPEHEEFYRTVSLTRSTGENVFGEPIVYGITIPETVRNRKGARLFIEFLLSEEGKEVMEDMGQEPIDPALTDNLDRMPEELRDLVTESEEDKF